MYILHPKLSTWSSVNDLLVRTARAPLSNVKGWWTLQTGTTTSSPDNVEQHVGILPLDVLQGPSKGVLTRLSAGKRMQKGIYMYISIYTIDIANIHASWCIVTVHCQIRLPRRLGSTPEGDEMHQHTGSLAKMGMFPAWLFVVRKENSSSWSSTWLSNLQIQYVLVFTKAWNLQVFFQTCF